MADNYPLTNLRLIELDSTERRLAALERVAATARLVAYPPPGLPSEAHGGLKEALRASLAQLDGIEL